jgi:uncharacterized protein YbaR (Trm112 family)
MLYTLLDTDRVCPTCKKPFYLFYKETEGDPWVCGVCYGKCSRGVLVTPTSKITLTQGGVAVEHRPKPVGMEVFLKKKK